VDLSDFSDRDTGLFHYWTAMENDLRNYMFSCLTFLPDFKRNPVCFAGTEHTLLVSKDGGINWQDALVALGSTEPVAITAVLSVPRPEQPPLLIAGIVGGFLRSQDGGQTWQVIPSGSPPPVITALASSGSANLYAGTADDGIFVSQDGGNKWVRWNFGLLDWHIFSIVVLPAAGGSQDVVMVGTESGIFRSTNNGRAWREVDFPDDVGAVLALGVSTAGQQLVIYAGTETGALFCSQDGGYTWAQVASGIFENEISVLVASGNSVLAASHEQLMVSHNCGSTWKAWNSSDEVNGSILSIAAPEGLESGQPVLVGTNGNIYLIYEE
jgi:photosystem II stability/assembly factor-like uncharacterized protein